MIIRQMTKEDATEVAQIEKECFSQPWSTQGFIDALDHSAFFLVAEEAKQILGYVGMYVTVPEGEITNVAVKPEYRDRKIGSALHRVSIFRSMDPTENLTKETLSKLLKDFIEKSRLSKS